MQPYQVSVWDTIPDSLKDPEGYWYGDYYGVMSFEVNTSIVKNPPQDWNDLLKSDYKGQVALAGDPRTSSQAINAVYAAALASGGSADNAGPGLDFFAKLNSAGNFVPVIAKQGTIAQGETPRWTVSDDPARRTALPGDSSAATSPGRPCDPVAPDIVEWHLVGAEAALGGQAVDLPGPRPALWAPEVDHRPCRALRAPVRASRWMVAMSLSASSIAAAMSWCIAAGWSPSTNMGR